MRKVLLTLLTIFLVSSLGFAEMNLKLNQNLLSETNSSIINNNLESNLKLEVPAEVVTPPADMKDFIKGMIILGILADVSFPLGGDGTDEDPGFGHIAGTGFSGHGMIGYLVTKSWMLTLRGGYVKFGEKTNTYNDVNGTITFTDNYNQIPILLGAYYLINTPSAFKPYIGLLLGVMIQNYTFDGTYSYSFGGQTYTDTETADKTSTGFGIVPALGCYYLLGSVMINLAVEYNILFGNLELTEDDYDYNPSSGFQKINGVAQEEEYTEEYTISYFSVLLGVSFPLGQ
jgi:outer membrane protein W